MKQENNRISRLLEEIQKEQEKHNGEIAHFIQEVQGIRARLVASHVMTRLTPIVRRMALERIMRDPYYPQVYKGPEETIQSSSQQPPL
jgi:hypothetical protein